MHSTRSWLCGAAAVLLILAAAAPARAEEKNVKVTVIAILATDQNKEINPKVKEIAQEVQKVDPSLTGFKLVQTTRSEEHKSELQSLMRISTAVFCLKKT